MDQKYDVIVVGAGIGGVSCAALLAQRGVHVLLIDKNSIPGGKAMTVGSDGFRYEFWPIVGGPAVGSRFESVLAEIGMSEQAEVLTPDRASQIIYRNAEGKLLSHIGSSNPQGGGGGVGVMSILGLQDANSTEVTRFFSDLTSVTDAQLEQLDDVSFAEFLARYSLPQSLISYFGMQANIIFVVPIDLLAASEMIRVTRDFGKGGAGRYHRGGFGRIAEACCQSIERNNGKVLLGSRVDRICVEQQRVCAVETAAGRFEAPIVVSNAGIQPTVLKLVGEGHFETGYVDTVKNLIPSWAIMGTRYFLDRPLFEQGMHVYFSDDNYMNTERFSRMQEGSIPDDLSVFNVVPAVYDAELAPPGKQCALLGTFCPADPDLPYADEVWRKLEQTAERLWPELKQCTESKVRYGNAQVSALTRDAVLPGQGGECIGLAQIVGQCGRHKPDARSPIGGLYYVGCDAGGYGCGTHQAVDSGANVADLVMNEQQLVRSDR